jgi:hypothetical protein
MEIVVIGSPLWSFRIDEPGAAPLPKAANYLYRLTFRVAWQKMSRKPPPLLDRALLVGRYLFTNS